MVEQVTQVVLLILLGVGSYTDLKSRSLPMALLVTGTVLGVMGAICRGFMVGEWNPASVSVRLLPGAVLIGISFLTREKIGYGDGCMALIIGLMEGVEMCLIILVAAAFLEAIVVLVLLKCKKISMETKVPFVPFLLIGYLLSLM